MELLKGVQNTVRANDRNTKAFGKVAVVDSAKVVYMDLRVEGNKVVVAVRQLAEKGFMGPVEIEEGYINGTLQEDLNNALEKKDWQVAMSEEPTAILTAEMVEEGVRIDNIAIRSGERRDNYERVLTEYMQQLSKTMGKKFVTAKSPLLKSHIKENSKEAKKYGKDMTFFDKKNYAKYLKSMGFESNGALSDLSVKNGRVHELHPGVVEVLDQSFKVSEITEIMQM